VAEKWQKKGRILAGKWQSIGGRMWYIGTVENCTRNMRSPNHRRPFLFRPLSPKMQHVMGLHEGEIVQELHASLTATGRGLSGPRDPGRPLESAGLRHFMR